MQQITIFEMELFVLIGDTEVEQTFKAHTQF